MKAFYEFMFLIFPYLPNRTYDIEVMNSPATLVPPSTFTVNYTLSNEYTQFPQYWVVETDYDNYAILYGCKLLSSGSHTSIYHHIYTYDYCTKRYSYPNLIVFFQK